MAAKRNPDPARGRATSRPQGGVTAIVLAAGSSSRMGEAKPLLRLGNKPLLLHTLDTLRASHIGEIVVVLGDEADRIRRAIPLDGTRVTTNADYAAGMSSSIRAGLRAASPEAEAFLIVLGDQPLVASSTIDALVARHESTHARILIPTYRGVRGNPVLLGRSLTPEMEAVRGDVGCRGVVASHAAEVIEVGVEDPGILVDVDTPADLEAIRKSLRDGAPLDRLV